MKPAVMADLAVAPGQPYIEVEYDYEYKFKDRMITIKQGECYLLVKKTNEDWWQVRKEEGSKAFYVPAQYVREVRRALMPPPKPLPHSGGGVGTRGGSVKSRPSRRERVRDQNAAGGESPRESSENIRNDSAESGDELSSSSTEQLQRCSDSPVYTNLQDLKISQSSQPPLPSSSPLSIHGDWETHKDPNGRNFYYNRATQERAWKPPRARDCNTKEKPDNTNTEPEVFSSEENYLSSQSDSQYGSPPRGWSEELDEYGHTLYVSDYTNEKWIKHTDEQGRPYYYSADGSRSEWELPKVNLRKQSEEMPKTRSLDRRQPANIVLTEWRRSTCVLEPNDKVQTHSYTDSDRHQAEKCGPLNVTKITEHGKKVRKNWTTSWTVLQGSSLLFAKNQGTATSWFGSHQSKPEFSVDLKGATVERASKDKSSKKHVLEVKTRRGTEILIQSDSETVINEWLKALAEAINTHAWESDEAIEEDMPESPGAEKHDKEKEHRDSKKLRALKNSTSMDSTEQKKTKTKLKKFLVRRPTLQAVRDKGYIKDQVFGSNLSSLCQRENTTVPQFVRMCIDHVEKNGLDLDGLYRVSGNLAVIQKLRFAVNHDEKINLEDNKWEDIHVTTGALKMFFRELPEPLFTYTLFNDFVSAISEFNQKVQAVKDKVKQLPRPNHDTMQALFKHLRKVIDHGEKNRMTTQSVAIVFGPTLLRPEIETLNMAVHMVYQNQIVELILLEYETIFGR
uniref:Rho GTPase activating protein 12a n=1 Tax=Astyanax mexicanus TaxID=7994 RepID=A0A8B9H422_ASTMX